MTVGLLSRQLGWADPERVFLALFGDAPGAATSAATGAPTAIWLDGGPNATSGMSMMGAPSRTVVVHDPARAMPELERLLASAPHVVVGPSPTSPIEPDEPDEPIQPNPLGWVGWLSYEVGSAGMGTPHHDAVTPSMALGFLDRAVVFDHGARSIRLLALDRADAIAWVDEVDAAVSRISPLPLDEPPAAPLTGPVRWRHGRDEYIERIRECQRLIAEGEFYQICLCNSGTVAGDVDPLAVHRRLRRHSPSHHGGLFRFGDVALVCGSPEEFLTVSPGGAVSTRPMKGTRPRGLDAAGDGLLADELRASEKERAENVMIVDLMRNDLSRVSEVGSVEVTELFAVEHYATVHQLVSTVESSLAASSSVADLLRATMPPGSMTGAPKHRAMTAIDRLEGGSRGVFSGVVGRFSLDGSVDLAVVIRSIVVSPGTASFGAGGGITALSDPGEEYDETMLKARSMLGALGVD